MGSSEVSWPLTNKVVLFAPSARAKRIVVVDVDDNDGLRVERYRVEHPSCPFLSSYVSGDLGVFLLVAAGTGREGAAVPDVPGAGAPGAGARERLSFPAEGACAAHRMEGRLAEGTKSRPGSIHGDLRSFQRDCAPPTFSLRENDASSLA